MSQLDNDYIFMPGKELVMGKSMNKTKTRKGILGRFAPAIAAASIYLSSPYSNVEATTTNQNNSSSFYAGLNYNTSLSIEGGYKTLQRGVAGFAEEGIGGAKAGLFDLTKYDLDLSGAVYLGETTGASVHLGKDFSKGDRWNLRPEVGAGYFNAGNEKLSVGFGSLLAQRQFGKNWTLSAGVRAYTDKNLNENPIEGLFSLSYGQQSKNSLSHISGLSGLEERLFKESKLEASPVVPTLPEAPVQPPIEPPVEPPVEPPIEPPVEGEIEFGPGGFDGN